MGGGFGEGGESELQQPAALVFTRWSHEGRAAVFYGHYLDNYICGAAKIFDIFFAASLEGTWVHKLAHPSCLLAAFPSLDKKRRTFSELLLINFQIHLALFKNNSNNNKVRSFFCLVCCVFSLSSQ